MEHNIIAQADQTTRFCSNILTVPKPSDRLDPSKAAQNIRKHENKQRDATRVVIDLTGVNKLTTALPPIALSSYKDLSKDFKNTNVSTFDLSGFFFALPLSYESQEITNFWFDGKIFKFTRCPMGARNSSVFAQMAGQLIFSELHLKSWAAQNNVILGSKEFPFLNPRDFLKTYIDDIVTYSKKDLGKLVHCKIIDFVFYCIKTSNVKLAKNKCNLFCEVFVYLGHKFSTTENIIRVPDTKRMFFINYRSPRSKAECLSRLGSLKYYDNFLPILNVLALPITKMAHSTDDFYWDDFLEQSWQAIKMVASLQMSNSTIDQNKTLFLACDASQVADALIYSSSLRMTEILK